MLNAEMWLITLEYTIAQTQGHKKKKYQKQVHFLLISFNDLLHKCTSSGSGYLKRKKFFATKC